MTSITPTNFPNVYVIYSSWSLAKIRHFLTTNLTNPKIGPLRIDYKNGKETNRTVAVLDDANFQELKEKGYTVYSKTAEFRIMPYVVKDIGLVTPGPDKRYSYYIRFPMGATDATVIENELREKLDELSEFGFFPKGSYTVRTPLVSREAGTPRNFCLVNFQDSVSRTSIIAGRIVLHQSHWRDHPDLLKCFWTINFAPQRPSFVRDEPKETPSSTVSKNTFADLAEECE